jgi:chromosome segregation ATPase
MSAEEAAKIRRENDQLKAEVEDLKGQLDQTTKKLEKTEKARQDYETKHSELQSQIKQDKISKAITDKLSELNVDSSAIPDERDLLLLRNKVELTDDGKVMVGEKELDEFMEEHKDSPRMKKIIKAPQNNGGGSGNAGGAGSGHNPWSKDHYNLTEQGRILREDPERAKQLKAEAGAKE